MLSSEYSAKLDKIWTGFSSTTELHAPAVLDLINSLLFIKQLDEIQAEKGRLSALSGKPVDNPIYTTDLQDLRWSSFHYLDQKSLFELFYRKNGVLEFAKSLPEYSSLQKFEKQGKPIIPSPYLLTETISIINQLNVPDNNIRSGMINYLLQKPEATKKTPLPKIPLAEKELQEVAIAPPVVNVSRKAFLSNPLYKLALFLFLGAIVFAIVYFNWDKSTGTTANINNPATPINTKENDTASIPPTTTQKLEIDTAAKKKPGEATKKVLPAKDSADALKNRTTKKTAPKSMPEQDVSKATVPDGRSGTEVRRNNSKKNNTTGGNKERYKILEKAYFHDQPDERTRRQAFINHWNNSYATLQALDEKNGFIYVVFRNHQNQTSKGWLRKKDLKVIQ